MPLLRDLQEFIDWAKALYDDLSDRLNAIDDGTETGAGGVKLNPLVLKIGEAIRSSTYNPFLTGAGITIEGNGTMASRTATLLGGRSTFTGVADFRRATVLGIESGGATGPVEDEIVFSQGVITATVSNPWRPQTARTITKFQALLGTTGASTLTVTVHVNGTTVGTVALASGVVDNSLVISVPVTAADVVTVAASPAGTGASGLTVIVRHV